MASQSPNLTNIRLNNNNMRGPVKPNKGLYASQRVLKTKFNCFTKHKLVFFYCFILCSSVSLSIQSLKYETKKSSLTLPFLLLSWPSSQGHPAGHLSLSSSPSFLWLLTWCKCKHSSGTCLYFYYNLTSLPPPTFSLLLPPTTPAHSLPPNISLQHMTIIKPMICFKFSVSSLLTANRVKVTTRALKILYTIFQNHFLPKY